MELNKALEELEIINKKEEELDAKKREFEDIVFKQFKEKVENKISEEQMLEDYSKIPTWSGVKFRIYKLITTNGYFSDFVKNRK